MENPKERFILFVARKKGREEEISVEESFNELVELVETAGAEVCGSLIQNVESIHKGYYLGKGKINELKELVEKCGASGVVCDDELTPMQFRNLTELLEIKVLDRTMIILDIFADRAISKEGKIQIEMARLKYEYSRVGGEGMSRQGIGGRGPGEKKLELDKRQIRNRMDILKQELEEIKRHRNLLRLRREKNQVPIIAIIGYTNVGKSTLLNAISGSNIYAENKLFATLDTTTRKVVLPNGSECRFIDTVGFIRKLPHHLVKAFYSTLEEAKFANIILHVIDASSPYIYTHNQVVEETLNHLDIKDIPIIKVYNKIDKLEDTNEISNNHSVYISALCNENINELFKAIENILYEEMKQFKICIPYNNSELVGYCHENAQKLNIDYIEEGICITGFIHNSKFYKISPYLLKNS
ncbi:GTPase HflX [Candidatus Epulonipiscium fishelsonii]|uniref:GTPase HflX n=1 Tax=Candidatus Epulonipiscium fishelsonii TaxID=77094 RepID=A0ACC8X6W3_9FIRM|nr:GTPase HflX [Epulopiscium sp. SCG-B11WGA-EpuloA1]ONI38326.1 GTPase HflX [Epulopiscium sp. SCG-B05WGA-EpuloA1]